MKHLLVGTDLVARVVVRTDRAKSPPAAFAAFIREQAAKYARIARAGNIQQE